MSKSVSLEKKQNRTDNKQTDNSKLPPSSTNNQQDLFTDITRKQHCLGETFTAFPQQEEFKGNISGEINNQKESAASSSASKEQVNNELSSGTPIHVSTMLANQIRDGFGIKASELHLRESSEVLDMGARATAQGNVISFAPGKFQPKTHKGLSLLGHELAHVQEQAQGNICANVQGTNIHYNKMSEKRSSEKGEAFAYGLLHTNTSISVGGLSAENMAIQRDGDNNDTTATRGSLRVLTPEPGGVGFLSARAPSFNLSLMKLRLSDPLVALAKGGTWIDYTKNAVQLFSSGELLEMSILPMGFTYTNNGFSFNASVEPFKVKAGFDPKFTNSLEGANFFATSSSGVSLSVSQTTPYGVFSAGLQFTASKTEARKYAHDTEAHKSGFNHTWPCSGSLIFTFIPNGNDPKKIRDAQEVRKQAEKLGR